VAASGPLAAKLAGRVGDGFICTSGKDPALYDELLAKVVEGADAAGRDPSAIRHMIEIKVSYDRDRELAFKNTEFWAALALAPEQKEGIEDPIEMERVANENLDKAHTRFICSNYPEEVVEKILFQHEIFGHQRFLLQLPVGTIPHDRLMKAIELFGSEVAPVVRDDHKVAVTPPEPRRVRARCAPPHVPGRSDIRRGRSQGDGGPRSSPARGRGSSSSSSASPTARTTGSPRPAAPRRSPCARRA